MKRSILITILLIGVGCSDSTTLNNNPFQMYEAIVAPLLGLKASDLYVPIMFNGNQDLGPKAAYCALSNRPTIGLRIVVSKEVWNKLSETARLSLIAHEMLHCYEHMEHHNGSDARGSLMSPHLQDSTTCVGRYGLEKCINDSYRLQELGIIPTFRDI